MTVDSECLRSTGGRQSCGRSLLTRRGSTRPGRGTDRPHWTAGAIPLRSIALRGRRLKLCIAVAYNDPTHLCEIARTAEEAGFGGIVVSDHIVYPERLETPYPYTSTGVPRWQADAPWPDPFVAIAAMAAVTQRLEFITSIFVLPLRHPVLAAKTIGTAAILSQGRVKVGVGAGWMREEFELLGANFEARGSRLEEGVEIMRALWRGGFAEYRGRHYDFDAVQMSPAPSVPIPIYGGGLSKAALRRAATRWEGWASEIQTTAEVKAIAAELRAYRADSERAQEPFGLCVALRDAHDADGFRRARDIGVTELITVPWLFYGADPDSLTQKCDGIRRFGDEVIAKLGD
jgi:probable F420-dependent oxidoreductase